MADLKQPRLDTCENCNREFVRTEKHPASSHTPKFCPDCRGERPFLLDDNDPDRAYDDFDTPYLD